MDAKNFILNRHQILVRLENRRQIDVTNYPFQMGKEYGIQLPAWARLALSVVTQGSVLSRFLQVGLPLAAPFLLRRQMPSWGRLVQRFFTPKS
jgi:hypothetical protein